MISPTLAGAAMTVDEVRARAAHYRTLTQREDIDPAIRECLLNLATIYEAYLSRLDKEAARRMRHRRRAKARCVDCGRPLGKMVADNGVEYTPMDFAEPVTFMQLAALGERLAAAGSRFGACVTALLRRSSVTMPLTARPATAAPTQADPGKEFIRRRTSSAGRCFPLPKRALQQRLPACWQPPAAARWGANVGIIARRSGPTSRARENSSAGRVG